MGLYKRKTTGDRQPNRIYLAAAVASILASATALAAVFLPPGDATNSINVIAFPQRDFISATGYLQGDQVVVRVKHDPAIYGDIPAISSGENAIDWILPKGDPSDAPGSFSGIVEVNHPGGACWKTNTPDIRPGDSVEIEIMASPDDTRVGRKDTTIVQNVTAKRPILLQAPSDGGSDGIVVVHGTAKTTFDANPGTPIVPVTSLEHRLVAPGELFPLSTKRTLRATSAAGANGTLAYDPVDDSNPDGTKWTATYTGLTAEDVKIALGAESRGMWINTNPANVNAGEITTYEVGALTVAGPAAPCNAPLETLPPPPGSELVKPEFPAVNSVTATVDNSNTVRLSWTEATDNVGVTSYGVYRNGQAIFNVQNDTGEPPAPTTFVDPNTPPGTYTYHVVAFDAVGNASDPSNESDAVTAVQHIDASSFPVVNDPPELPINIIAFPSRDFISPSGYLPNDKVTVQVLRQSPSGQNVIVSSADGITPDEEGFAEVNHPGGSCWAGVTPEIRAGDIIRTIAYNTDLVPATVSNPDSIRSVDMTRIAGVTAFQPVVVTPPTLGNSDGVVEVHGTALGADGNPLPIDQIEQRMIATHGLGLWDLNSRRALRAASAGGDGTLSYDTLNNPMGVKWTATYSGLDQADVDRMADADTRIHWLGRDPLLLNEATIFENAPGTNPPGPAGPGCTRPLEQADDFSPAQPSGFSVVANANQNQLTFSWTQAAAPQDDWYVAGYRIFDDGLAVANAGPDATSLTLTNVLPGRHNFKLVAYDSASPLVGPVSDGIITRISAGLGNLYGNLSSYASLTHASGGGGGVTLDGSGDINLSDVLPPSSPTNLTYIVRDAGDSGAFIDLTWSAATDNIGVVKYIVHRGSSGSGPGGDFDVLGAPPATDYTDTLNASGSRTYSVTACDLAGNCTDSALLTVNIPEEFDAIAPVWPVDATVTATNPDIHTRNVTVNWSAAQDNIAPSVIARYELYRGSNTAPTGLVSEKIATIPGNILTYSETVVAGTYQYALIAYDSAGNPSSLSPVSTALVVANDVPLAGHSLIGFPARDFISATGSYDLTHTYSFALLRGASTMTTDALPPILDPSGALVEANHPGLSGTCWNLNTPDMRAGDVIRIIDNSTGIAEQTTIANVTADRPIAINANTVVIHGTAQLANGTPIPVAQLDQRLISGKASAFDNNKRLLRTGAGDGTLVYDAISPSNPNGTQWTATYTGLSVNDVLRAVGGTNAAGTVFVGAESRILWLGRDPLALTEGTIFENGSGVAGGPVGPRCTAPAETPVAASSFSPASIAFLGTSFNPSATSASQTVTFSNGGGAPLTLTNIYFAGANPGDFIRQADPAISNCPTAFPAVLNPGTVCTVKVQFRPTAFGLRQANLSFSGNAANTTDLTVPLSGNATDTSDPRISLSSPSLAFGTVNGGANAVRTLTVSNTGTGIPLTVTGISFNNNGAALADYTATHTCASVNAGGNCTITVTFRPGATGARNAAMVIAHNRTLPNASVNTSVTLTGTGGTGAVLSFASNPVTFGTVNRNATKDQTVTLKNSGTAATFGVPKFTPGGAGFSLVSTTCGVTLAANGSCNAVVRFTAPNTVGAFVGSLTVLTTNGLPSSLTTSLSASTK